MVWICPCYKWAVQLKLGLSDIHCCMVLWFISLMTSCIGCSVGFLHH